MNITTPDGLRVMAEILKLRESNLTAAQMEMLLGLPAGTVRNAIRNFRKRHPGALKCTRMPAHVRTSVSPWSPERLAYLTANWDSQTPRSEVLAAVNKLPPGAAAPVSYHAVAAKAAHLKLKVTKAAPEPIGRLDDDPAVAIKRGNTSWLAACTAARLRFDDHPDLAPVPVAPAPRRKGIMAGPDPRTAEMIAARAQMAQRTRVGAVGEVAVRGLA